MRPVEDLEGAAPRRPPRLDGVHLDDPLARAHRRVQVGAAAERDAHERDSLAARRELGGLSLEKQRRAAVGEPVTDELATPGETEEEDVVCAVTDLARLVSAEMERLERELRALLRRRVAFGADDSHQRPRYAFRRPSSSSRSDAFPSSTTRPVEST